MLTRCALVQELTAGDPMVLAASKLAVEEVKKVLRRIHAAESKAQRLATTLPYQRQMAKICRGHALAVMDTIVSQVRRRGVGCELCKRRHKAMKCKGVTLDALVSELTVVELPGAVRTCQQEDCSARC